jgi:hypothetical protein
MKHETKPYAKQARILRYFNHRIKRLNNEIKAYNDEVTFHQAVIDNIKERFGIKEILNGEETSLDTKN